jgi:hypothetical protein
MDRALVFGTRDGGSIPSGRTNIGRMPGILFLSMTKLNTKERTRLLAVAKKYGTPLYVYDAAMISAQCEKLKRNFKDTNFHSFAYQEGGTWGRGCVDRGA